MDTKNTGWLVGVLPEEEEDGRRENELGSGHKAPGGSAGEARGGGHCV
jgi:hypothetical protein